MNHTKDNPIGIDKPIQRIQNKLYNKLGYENLDGYGRVYLVEKENKTFPAHFLKGIDYKELLVDDSKSINARFFFLESDKTDFKNPYNETEVSIIFLLNLKRIKPNNPYRADEECKKDIQGILNSFKIFHLKTITKGKKALSDFDTNLADMQPYHFLKFTGTIRYQINCN